MNLATPILICANNDDFRSLLREMLIKHGFFHLLEATSSEELIELSLKEKKIPFIMVQGELINEGVNDILRGKKDLLILIQPSHTKTLALTARYGVENFLSFPFSSQQLFNKLSKFS